MCGRYANHVNAMRSWIRILGDWPKNVRLSYNVSPTQEIPVFTAEKGVGMRWGLIPHWSKDDKAKYATFNARVETVDSKPVYRTAWRKSQRCLIPALGFYEWRKEGQRKQPYYIQAQKKDALVFGGIWDFWKAGEKEILSCSIMTRPANAFLSELHPRMPVILTQAHALDWLHVSPKEAMQLMGIQDVPLEAYKVGFAVNNARNDGPELIQKIS